MDALDIVSSEISDETLTFPVWPANAQPAMDVSTTWSAQENDLLEYCKSSVTTSQAR